MVALVNTVPLRPHIIRSDPYEAMFGLLTDLTGSVPRIPAAAQRSFTRVRERQARGTEQISRYSDVTADTSSRSSVMVRGSAGAAGPRRAGVAITPRSANSSFLMVTPPMPSCAS